ncbi:MAG: hypothetical protein SGILL_001961 [Bacillariaceae sp.]
MASTYVAIRDDSGLKSLSVNERDFLRLCALRGSNEDDVTATVGNQKILRADGRRGTDVRKVRLKLGRWDNGAEATVQWGAGTRVTSLCTAELVPPSPDRPNEGMVSFTVDLSPMAAPSFRLAPAISTGGQGSSGNFGSRGSNYSDQDQRLLSNRILRCIERIILIGGALDTEALVLEGGKWVWKFTISLTVLDAGGNLLDACVLAAVAALRHYRKPQVDLSADNDSNDTSAAVSSTSMPASDSPAIILPTMIPSAVKEATPLPLHHSPLSISFGLIPADDAVNSTSSTSVVAALIDPTDREELVQSGSLTIAMNIHSEVCLLDYGGGCELTPDKLRECWKVAEGAIKELCQLLEEALSKADEQANAERLRQLQLQAHPGGELPPLPPATSALPSIPFVQQLDDNMDVAVTVDESKVQTATAAADEAYRKQALDYSSGHFATAVREDSSRDQSKRSSQAGSLLAAMLKSVGEKPVLNVDPSMDMEPSTETPLAATEEPQNREMTESESKVETKLVKSVAKTTRANPSKMMDINDDDDDEEEQPMVLQSEFDSIKPPTLETEAAEAAEPDIEDLSMAIKSKKSKKKKSKKSK